MSTIQLRTPVPGPKSLALSARRAKAVPRGLSHGTPIYVAKAEDAWLEDVDGNRYIDFAGGIGCANAGHRQQPVIDAISTQLNKYLHTCVQVTPYEGYVELAERMNQVTPGKFPKKTLFVNSGAEAVENAVKIARAYTKRPAIIAFEDAFHGRTMMTLALTSKTHPYKAGFAPFPGDVYRVPFAYCYRCSYNLKYPSCDLYCARHLQDTFKRVVANEEVAAVIAEPVMGEGGFIAPPLDYFKVLIDLCHKHNILFIADEVQSGFGRTGKMFAIEYYGVEPDILVTAKGIADGFPLSAFTASAEIAAAYKPGDHLSTFGGNPVSCAAALANIEFMEKENLPARATETGNYAMGKLRELQKSNPLIGEVRGLGLMIGVELVKDAQKTPASAEAEAIRDACLRKGLLIGVAGVSGNVVRFQPPLVISKPQIDQALNIFVEVLQEVAQPAHATA